MAVVWAIIVEQERINPLVLVAVMIVILFDLVRASSRAPIPE